MMTMMGAAVVFFTVKPPVDPVVLVHRICEDASSCKGPRRTRFTRRLTPLSLIGRASEMSLTEVAAKVLAPHFHLQDGVSKKVSGRPLAAQARLDEAWTGSPFARSDCAVVKRTC